MRHKALYPVVIAAAFLAVGVPMKAQDATLDMIVGSWTDGTLIVPDLGVVAQAKAAKQ